MVPFSKKWVELPTLEIGTNSLDIIFPV